MAPTGSNEELEEVWREGGHIIYGYGNSTVTARVVKIATMTGAVSTTEVSYCTTYTATSGCCGSPTGLGGAA